jgi:hypothetical protein
MVSPRLAWPRQDWLPGSLPAGRQVATAAAASANASGLDPSIRRVGLVADGEGACLTGWQAIRKEVRRMALYTIIRIYKIPARNQIEATNRMMEALTLHVERDYHDRDIIREPDAKPGTGVRIELTPPKGWGAILLDQLLGSTTKR